MRDATCEHHSRRCELIRKNKGPVDRSHTIPIETAKTPRLPPWEIFQRGPPVQQAAPSHLGPRRKIFTIPDSQRTLWMPQSQPATPPFVAHAKSETSRTHTTRTLLPFTDFSARSASSHKMQSKRRMAGDYNAMIWAKTARKSQGLRQGRDQDQEAS